jgi:hypothetical protein
MCLIMVVIPYYGEISKQKAAGMNVEMRGCEVRWYASIYVLNLRSYTNQR